MAAWNTVLALDLGTSSCKGALYTSDGRRVALASEGYPVRNPQPGYSEQAPADYLQAVHRLIERLASGGDLHGIAFSTQTPTLVFLDGSGNPLGPAIVWQDSRAGAESSELTAIPHREDWFGMDLPIGATTTPPKLLWMTRHNKERWAATRWVVQPKDFVAFALTGHLATDRWCAKGIAHLHSGEMHPDWMALLGKHQSVCPAVRSTRAVIGKWNGIPVINGWSDALAAILATGAMHTDRRAFVLTGTSEIIGISRHAAQVASGLFHVPPDVMEVPALSLHYGPTQAGGSCLDWIARILDKPVQQVLEMVPPGLTSIVFRPYLHGERAPFWDNNLTASFEGLRAQHGAADLVHAVLQGVAQHERVVLELAEQHETATQIVLAGGAARNTAWNRIRAAVLQRPLLVMKDTEASLRGAALLGWSALDNSDPADRIQQWFDAEDLPAS
jgi:xylulokinase